MTHNCDIIIFGGGIAGLFIANRLAAAGYDLILIEKDALGGKQTLASQGMIHGGQKYALRGKATHHARFSASMVKRWDACFAGTGDIDLSGVRILNASQTLFPAGGFIAKIATVMAALAVSGQTRKIAPSPVYEMREKVLETKSLAAALIKNLKGRIFKGDITRLSPDGEAVVSGLALRAQVIIFTAGAGNETALHLLRNPEKTAQRRPLRQIMVKPLPYALYGHGLSGKARPRVTVTSHSVGAGEYAWYLGGNVAEKGASMPEPEALAFAKKEMTEIFPHIDWKNKEWASLLIDRAEPLDSAGHLPPGPCLHQHGKVLVAWPVKMTFTPALSDKVLDWLHRNGIIPLVQESGAGRKAPPALPEAEIGIYPWEKTAWRRL